MTDLVVAVAGTEVILLPERALLWPDGRTLVVADPHWGKAAAFRALGVPVPRGTTTADLDRLAAVIARTGPSTLVVLGDLYHAAPGRRARETHRAVAIWRAGHPSLGITLVRGNHDRHAGDPAPDLDIAVADGPLPMPPFTLVHEPGTATDGYELAGHVHPGVRLRGAGRQRERLPCFALGPRGAVLPAFGGFTGLQLLEPAADVRVFAVAGDAVLDVTR